MTKITKYPQSAILIEYKNKRILIDPGSYCYNENFSPNDWGKKEAAKFSKEINPKIIIPIHYDNPRFPTDVNDFVKEMNGCNVKVLKNGESIKV